MDLISLFDLWFGTGSMLEVQLLQMPISTYSTSPTAITLSPRRSGRGAQVHVRNSTWLCSGRYSFLYYGVSHGILRRSVFRPGYYYRCPHAGVAIYCTDHTITENVIVFNARVDPNSDFEAPQPWKLLVSGFVSGIDWTTAFDWLGFSQKGMIVLMTTPVVPTNTSDVLPSIMARLHKKLLDLIQLEFSTGTNTQEVCTR